MTHHEGRHRRAALDVPHTLVKGALIGIANIIPGVSGGTFALILGIFDRMVAAIHSIGPRTAGAVLAAARGGPAGRLAPLRAEWRRIDGAFLALLASGALAAILAGAFAIEYLLARHHTPTLAFFIGLILPSLAIPWRMMDRRGVRLLAVLPGIALTVGLSLMFPGALDGSDHPLIAALSGALAVSAMILPGISGSYVLLVLGQYQNVIGKLTGLQRGLAEGRLDFPALFWLLMLAGGMVVGLLLFARLLHWLLARARSTTLAFLIGLLLGSLWVLWPFKEVDRGALVRDRHGEVKLEVRIATAPNRLPQDAREIAWAAGAFVLGLAGSAGMIRIGSTGDGSRDRDQTAGSG